MRLPELQDDDKEAMKLRSEGLPEGWEDIEQVLHYQGLPAVTFAWYRKQSGASPSVEGPIHGFCDGSSNLNQVEG